jgi:photosystem II stability/assembly factor-like uncharacterized protein
VAAAFMLLFSFTGCEQPDDDGDDEINIGKIGGPNKEGDSASGGNDSQTVNDNLTIHPLQISVRAGIKQHFRANIGGETVEAEWSIEDGTENGYIDSNGVLTVNETACGTITVKAEVEDKEPATALVTISSEKPSIPSDGDIETDDNPEPINWGLSVAPSSVELTKGETQQFESILSGYNEADDNMSQVTWLITGKQSESTDIDESGLLTIGNDETAETINVIARIDEDTFGMAVVNIKSSSSGGGTDLKPGTDFETDPDASYGIVINPTEEISLIKGSGQLFQVTFFAPKGENTQVVWGVNGSNRTDNGTEITEINGDLDKAYLRIAENETLRQLTITASIVVGGVSQASSSMTINILPDLSNWKEYLYTKYATYPEIKSIAYGKVGDGQDMFVVVDNEGRILYYTSDNRWSSVNIPNGFPHGTNRVRFLNNKFFAVCDSAVILRSDDGVNWYDHIVSNVPEDHGIYDFEDITSTPYGFIVVGKVKSGERAGKGLITYTTQNISVSDRDDLINWEYPAEQPDSKMFSVVAHPEGIAFIVGGDVGILLKYGMVNNTMNIVNKSGSYGAPRSISDILFVNDRFFLESQKGISDILFVNDKFFTVDSGIIYHELNGETWNWQEDQYNTEGFGHIVSMIYIEDSNKFIATTSKGKVISTN